MNDERTLPIVDYLFGTADSAAREKIESLLAEPKLAAQLKLLSGLAGVDAPTLTSTQHGVPAKAPAVAGRTRWIRMILTLALAAALAGGAYVAAQHVLRTPPLLADAFDDARLDDSRWTTFRHVVVQENGYLRLQDRGYLVTTGKYPGPLTIDFDWMPVDLAHQPQHGEILTVVLHTTGKPRGQHPFEVLDGLVVKIDAREGRVTVAAFDADGTARFEKESPPGGFPLPPGEWHQVRIVDTLKSLSVFVEGPAMPRSAAGKPLLQLDYEGSFAGEQIAIYNREFVAEVPQESRIDNFVITAITPEETPP